MDLCSGRWSRHDESGEAGGATGEGKCVKRMRPRMRASPSVMSRHFFSLRQPQTQFVRGRNAHGPTSTQRVHLRKVALYCMLCTSRQSVALWCFWVACWLLGPKTKAAMAGGCLPRCCAASTSGISEVIRDRIDVGGHMARGGSSAPQQQGGELLGGGLFVLLLSIEVAVHHPPQRLLPPRLRLHRSTAQPTLLPSDLLQFTGTCATQTEQTRWL